MGGGGYLKLDNTSPPAWLTYTSAAVSMFCRLRVDGKNRNAIRYSSSDFATEGMQDEYWFHRNWSSLAATGARGIDIQMRFDRTSGTNNDGAIDDIVLKIYTRE